MLTIDKEFKELIPPLTKDERQGLEESILNEGCRDPLIVWGDIIVDGHNRYEICIQHNIPYKTIEREFDTRDDVIIWIIKNQFGRRNLPAYERARLALRLKPVLAEKAKEHQGTRTDILKNSWESNKQKEIEKIKQQNLSKEAELYHIDAINKSYAKKRKYARMADDKHVYLAKIDDKLKVGSSCDVEERIKQLKTAAPTIELIEDIPFGYGVEKFENSIKKKYASEHIDGEIYNYSDNLVKDITAYTKREAARKKETNTIIADTAGVSVDTIAKVAKIEAKAPEEVKEKLRTGDISINEAYKAIKKEEKRQERQESIEEQISQPKTSAYVDIYTTKNKYRVIYADPPWSYGDKQNIDGLGGAEKHYPTMPLDDICNLPIPTTDDAVLFIWVTSPMLEDCFKVINAWGFKYKSSFVWDKVKHNMGHYNSVRHELLLICTKGSCTPDKVKLYDSVISIERTDHSRKPDKFREIIDELYPIGKRLEMFAREASDGWDVWGNMA